MTSTTRPSFWRYYKRLPNEVKARAKQAYKQFAEEPAHPSLHFKKLRTGVNIWSVRISDQYRAVGVRQGDTVDWIWIGSHSEFDRQFS